MLLDVARNARYARKKFSSKVYISSPGSGAKEKCSEWRLTREFLWISGQNSKKIAKNHMALTQCSIDFSQESINLHWLWPDVRAVINLRFDMGSATVHICKLPTKVLMFWEKNQCS